MRLDELIDDFKPNEKELGFLTFDEYLERTNPDGKTTPSESYQSDIASLNTTYPLDNKRVFLFGSNTLEMTRYKKGDIIKYNGIEVGVVKDNTLYKILKYPSGLNLNGYFDYNDLEVKNVRYIDGLINEITDRSKDNLRDYPHVWQNIKVGDEEFQIRSSVSKSDYQRGSQETIVVMDKNGLRVSTVQDEYGATLLMTAKEYRGYGFGKRLFGLWQELNPDFNSGGYSRDGIKAAKSAWASRVRELLKRGIYTKAIAGGILTKKKVNDILSDLPKTSAKREVKDKKKEGEILYYVKDTQVIIYDSNYLEDQNDEYIKGYGLIEHGNDGYFVYDIGYEQGFEKVTHLWLASAAKSYDDSLIISSPPSEHNSYSTMGFNITDGVIDLSGFKSVIEPSKVNRERNIRKSKDPYGELTTSLITDAESKWD